MGYLGSGVVPRPQGSGASMIVPYEAFPTTDGHLMIAAGSDALFVKACEALGLRDLVQDPRFADNPSRMKHRAALFERIAEVTRQEEGAALLGRLRRVGVPCSQILTIDQVVAEPQTEASGMLMGGEHPRIPDFRSVGLPITWDGARPPVVRVPSLVGEHTAEVLEWLGYGADEIRRLAGQGTVQVGEGT